jgi:hypothetical protein
MIDQQLFAIRRGSMALDYEDRNIAKEAHIKLCTIIATDNQFYIQSL